VVYLVRQASTSSFRTQEWLVSLRSSCSMRATVAVTATRRAYARSQAKTGIRAASQSYRLGAQLELRRRGRCVLLGVVYLAQEDLISSPQTQERRFNFSSGAAVKLWPVLRRHVFFSQSMIPAGTQALNPSRRSTCGPALCRVSTRYRLDTSIVRPTRAISADDEDHGSSPSWPKAYSLLRPLGLLNHDPSQQTSPHLVQPFVGG
jgi:hypothetical protein